MVSSASAALDMDGVEQLDKSMTSNHSGTPTSNNHSLSYQRERLNIAIRMMKICLWHYWLKFCPKPGNRCKRKKMNLRRREHFINQTVDKTFEKLTQFMKESGIVFHNLEDPDGQKDKGDKQEVQEDQTRLRQKVQNPGYQNNKGKPSFAQISGVDGPSSGTTIYDTAIEQVNGMEDPLINKTPKRISTSSEKIGENEISDEVVDTLDNLNNLSLISGHQEETRRQLDET